MYKACRLPFLAACVLAFPALADEVATAAGLVGTWEGRWIYDPAVSGRLVVTISSANGTSLKGKSMWYATTVGDFGDTFSKTKLKDNKLSVTEPTMDFEATLSADGLSMEGTWTSPVATGTLKLQKKVEAKPDAKPQEKKDARVEGKQ